MIAANNDVTQIPAGGGGVLFSRPDNLRSDARLAARIISLGVVDEAQAAELLKQGMTLAKLKADEGDARGYSACMKIAIEAAKLEQKERQPSTGGVTVNVQNNGGNVAINDPATELAGMLATLRDRARETEDRGTVEEPLDG